MSHIQKLFILNLLVKLFQLHLQIKTGNFITIRPPLKSLEVRLTFLSKTKKKRVSSDMFGVIIIMRKWVITVKRSICAGNRGREWQRIQ